MLYICTKFCQSISKGYKVIDPDIRVGARVISTVDGWTYGRAYEQTENRIPISQYAAGRRDKKQIL